MSNLLVQNIKHTNGTTAQTIDSSGRVLTPARPFFEVTKSGNQTGITSNSSANAVVITFNVVGSNVGSHFDTSNSRFIAPVTGVYQFNFSILLQNVDNSDDGIHVSFFIDGSQKIFFSRNVGESAQGYYGYGGYLPVQGSAAFLLSASSFVDMRINAGGGNIGIYGSSDWSHFSGYLIG